MEGRAEEERGGLRRREAAPALCVLEVRRRALAKEADRGREWMGW